jgi:hypothetical protein
MTPNHHDLPPDAGTSVSIVERYPAPDNDPDMQEYDNIGDAFIIREDVNE